MSRPPRVFAAIIARLLPGDVVEPLLGDLEEEFQEWCEELGEAAARRRYHMAALLSLCSVVARRLRVGSPTASADCGLDLKYASRAMAKRRRLSLAIVGLLSLGIGGNVAVFSVVETALLRPLPYSSPDRLHAIWSESNVYPLAPTMSGPDYFDVRDRTAVFESVEAAFGWRVPMSIDGALPRGVDHARVSAGFFDLLGVEPAVGRLFLPEEDVPGGPGIAVLSHRAWLESFAGSLQAVGSRIDLGGESFEIAGVLPAGFRMWLPPGTPWSAPVDVWTNLRYGRESFPRAQRHLLVLAKSRVGVPRSAIAEDVDRVSSYVRRQLPRYAENGFTISAETLQASVVGDLRKTLLALWGAAVLVIVLVGANLAALWASAAWGRRQEYRLRRALGASGARLIRQGLCEAAIVCSAALLGAGAVAAVSLGLIREYAPASGAILEVVRVGPWSVVYALVLSAFVIATLGWVAGQMSRLTSPGPGGGERATPGGSRLHTITNTMVVVQVALSVSLLAGSTLMVKTLIAMTRADLGYDPRNSISFTVQVAEGRYEGTDAWTSFIGRIESELGALPGIEAVGIANALPLTGAATGAPFAYGGVTEQADMRVTSAGYLAALGGRLLAGRYLRSADRDDTAPVVVVNQTLARAIGLTPRDAVGRTVEAFRSRVEIQIVGVIEDIPSTTVAAPRRPMMIFPHAYFPGWQVRVVLRGNGAEASAESVRQRITAVDATVAVDDTRTMASYVAEAMQLTHLTMTLLVILSAFAGLIAAVGLYSVISYLTRLRAREVGIRLALGSRRIQVATNVMGKALRLAGLGLLLGLIAAAFGGRMLRALLYGTDPTDPLAFLVPAIVMSGLGAVAAAIPAARAALLDPSVLLREE